MNKRLFIALSVSCMIFISNTLCAHEPYKKKQETMSDTIELKSSGEQETEKTTSKSTEIENDISETKRQIKYVLEKLNNFKENIKILKTLQLQHRNQYANLSNKLKILNEKWIEETQKRLDELKK